MAYFSENHLTMALRALIVDDESDARDNLRLMLEEECPEVQIVGQAGSAPEAREKIQALQPNALFLDIKMPGEDGFALARVHSGIGPARGLHNSLR
jgi:two-component system LytT family response regulator